MRHIRTILFVVFVTAICLFLLEIGSYAILKYILHVPLLARHDAGSERALYVWNRESAILPYGVKKNFQQEHNTDEFQTTIQTNNVGMREQDDYYGEHVDIGFVGDSMTFGWGVNYGERYSDFLQEYFPDKKVLSYGYLDGLTTPHYYLFFKNNPQYIPDTAILGLYPDNDLDVDIRDTKFNFDQSGEPISTKFVIRYVTDRGALGVGYDAMGSGLTAGLLANSYTGKLAWLGWLQSVSIYNKKKFGSREQERQQIGLEYIEKLKELLEKNDSRLVVFMIPPRAHFLEKEYPRWGPVKQWLAEHQIEFIDPVPAFTKQGGAELYYSKDTHWTKQGHRMAADLIYKYLLGN